jgi:dCMP deaminase
MEMRKVEVESKGVWQTVESLADVKKGQGFRMTEPDGTFIGRFRAMSDGFVNSKGIPEIMSGDYFPVLDDDDDDEPEPIPVSQQVSGPHCWWMNPKNPEFADAMRKRSTYPARWDDLFMEIAKAISQMSKCASRHIGVVVVRDRQILSMGYNGSPAGSRLCQFPEGTNGVFCPRKRMGFKSGEGIEFCPAQHGEENAVANAAKNGICIAGATIYCYCGLPCQRCAGALINAGIKKVVCLDTGEYDTMAKLLFEQAEVEVEYYKES